MLPERRDEDLLLELHALGELPEELAPEVARRLEQDPEARAYLEQREAAQRQILEHLPPEPALEQIRRRAAAERLGRRVRVAGYLGGALATAAALLLVVLQPLVGEHPGASGRAPDQIAIKGTSRLQLFRNGKGRPLAHRATVTAGDVLELRYLASGQDRHGIILSVDGRATVSLHFPADPGDATLLVRDRSVELGHAFELDETPGFERFFFLTGPDPIPVRQVLAAARALKGAARRGRLRLPAGVRVRQELLLRKTGEAPPAP